MIALIVAYAKNNVIGLNGKIPWNIKSEQKRFKDLTTNNVVIMGRKTFEEIEKPLPNRYTIVISNTKKFEYDNCTTVSSLKEALEISKGKDVYISGGYAIYKEAIDIVDKMYITEIDLDVKGDVFFPKFDESKFEKILEKTINDDVTYRYYTYTKK